MVLEKRGCLIGVFVGDEDAIGERIKGCRRLGRKESRQGATEAAVKVGL